MRIFLPSGLTFSIKWEIKSSTENEKGKFGKGLDTNGGFPGSSDDKESALSAADLGSVLELGRSPGEGHGTPLQYSCLENPMDRGAWWATVHGVTKRQTQLSNEHFH